MAGGRGKGSADGAGVIAASCCTICCVVCFFVVALPMLIGGIVCLRIYEGDYDTQVYEAQQECYTDNGYSWLDQENDDAIAACGNIETYEDVKDICRIVGIVFIVIFVLTTIGGVVMIVLMCTAVCKSSPRQQTIVMTQPNQGYVYPAQPTGGPIPYQDPAQAYPPPKQADPNQAYPNQGYVDPNQGYPTKS